MKELHVCDNCGDRIFRWGYKIDNKLYCKRCVKLEFGTRFDDDDYILKVKNKSKDDVQT